MAEMSGYPPPILESYSVEAPAAVRTLAAESRAVSTQEWKLSLHGKNFFERAMMPIIKIGNIRVHKYEITPDGCTIVCYLQELPEEGAEVSVTYGPGVTATLPQRFSRSQLRAVLPEPSETEGEGEE